MKPHEGKAYNHAQALIDIFASVRFSKEIGHVPFKGNQLVEVRRFEWVASNRFLQKRWGWSNSKVLAFLSNLEKQQIVTREKRQGNTIIKLSKSVICDCRYSEKATPKTTGIQSNEATDKATNSKKDSKNKEGRVTPPSPLNCDSFLKTWDEYEIYRREMDLPELCPSSTRKNWDGLQRHGLVGAIKLINESISKLWKSIPYDEREPAPIPSTPQETSGVPEPPGDWRGKMKAMEYSNVPEHWDEPARHPDLQRTIIEAL